MLSMKDIRQYVSDLGIAADDNVYIGKLDNKVPKSIGVYSRSTSGQLTAPIGGFEFGTYGVRPVSILVHWTKRTVEAEKAAFDLFEKLKLSGQITIGGSRAYIRLMVPEPQDVGTDDAGVFEYVIWADFIYNERKGE